MADSELIIFYYKQSITMELTDFPRIHFVLSGSLVQYAGQQPVGLNMIYCGKSDRLLVS